MEKRFGFIYLHRNKINGHCYVGLSTQTEERRFRKSQKDYAAYKNCIALYNALCKYTWDGFETEILAYGDSEEELKELEAEFITKYDCSGGKGYNIVNYSEGRIKQPPETREKIGQKQKESSAKKKAMGIVTVASNRKAYKEIDGITHKHCAKCEKKQQNPWHPLSNFNNVTKNWDKLHRHCKLCQSTSRKEQYLKHEVPNLLTKEETKQSHIDRKENVRNGVQNYFDTQTPEERKAMSVRACKKIKRTDLITGEVKIYDSGLACKNEGFNNTSVSEVCNGKRPFYKGYKWEFLKD